MAMIWSCLILIVFGQAAAAPAPAEPPRSFAVFSAAYTPGGGEVRGGVGGTAFFITPTVAITAYHVVSPALFTAAPGRKHRSWLVRENFRAIELKPEYVTYHRNKDLTVIRLPESEAVPAGLVYPTFTGALNGAKVESHGFVALSTGPALAWVGADVEILKVPALQRRNMSGTVLREARVSLNARDVLLENAPCVQLSYQPIVGMSGGPVVAEGKVLAMNSFADPGTMQQSWALRLNP